VKAWAYDRDMLGPPPPGVEVVAEPEPDVEFVVPRWEALPALDEIPGLRVVQVLSAGVDWIADRVPPGVTLCSARGARDRAMAEWVMAAILADAKGAREIAEQQGRRHWELVKLGDASNLRVLVLGFGSIGRALATMLAAFDCEVVGVARRARDGIHGTDELPALLPEADVVVNLLPLTEATHGAIGAHELAAMRDGALYVNAGRGATTDTGALVDALGTGRIRAVLDVVDPEPLPADHPLWTAPGVMISPHSAGDTPAADRAAWALAAAQLRRYAAGEELENVVSDGY
jgi:phosphoglycerate dehydrogenase-like enzyme